MSKAAPESARGTIGIIGAMSQETELLCAELQHSDEREVMGFRFYAGQLDGQQVIVTQCGIGKVNAAMGTTALLSQGVSRVIFTGVAGGVHPSLKVGDMVVSTDCLQHDVDVQALGYAAGLIPGEALSWPADGELRKLAVQAARTVEGVGVLEGRVVSGDQFIASPQKAEWLRTTFGAVCAEMEGAAVAQVCARWNVPFVVIRSMSDTADHTANVDYSSFMPVVARRAKQVVREMLRGMAR
ncbi:5'-methylthioadenosine/adenosylhomocysteine nucleosidase [Deinococcus peraridilitoris]|uniref:adenosylhomocysteine nucleosidase n=1 Tax=Deinococcus peraridilitoris (strain DSM 19664 / LMG 22246 / CIP 109416 / KR-200) TaxID=937777 RepID=L0A6B5_DEIPD|nr:5'-methylthioadenosine/adenosylhomocysteine nucleosidase [Deinococcus peraridilitoris]AFZ68707.1 5'-methylthioadenosine/S-adenosylhomocysteine nucleosidase [Deinococcus peraridilitoris DSM 19664]